MFWWMVLAVIGVIVLLVKVHQKLTLGICKSSAHMVGKVVIVTGGNSGIGFETAKDLACRGARVILACRSVRKAEIVKEELIKASGNTDIICKQLDLSSLESVRNFCEDIDRNEKRLDVLINNAGAGGLGNYKTADGLHVGMQVNYFAPFLLTCLLLPLLRRSEPSRIINVSSMLHKYGELDFENLNMEKYWSDYLVYANSKLFLNLMTLELSRRLNGSRVTVNCLHPGIAATNLMRNVPSEIMKKIISKSIGFMFQSAWEASQTSIYLSVAPEIQDVSGKYFSHCCETKPSKLSLDVEKAKKLWDESEKLVKFTISEN